VDHSFNIYTPSLPPWTKFSEGLKNSTFPNGPQICNFRRGLENRNFRGEFNRNEKISEGGSEKSLKSCHGTFQGGSEKLEISEVFGKFKEFLKGIGKNVSEGV
jgi:hypothetical protein